MVALQPDVAYRAPGGGDLWPLPPPSCPPVLCVTMGGLAQGPQGWAELGDQSTWWGLTERPLLTVVGGGVGRSGRRGLAHEAR